MELMVNTETKASLQIPFLADLVALARGLNPFPYRTRPLNSSAPMVLSLKAWKSRSLPGLPRTKSSRHDDRFCLNPPRVSQRRVLFVDRRDEKKSVLGRPGSDLLFQALRLSTIGAEGFNGRVRYGNGFRPLARTTRSAKDGFASWFSVSVVHQRLAPRRALEMRTIKIERAIRTGKLNASLVSALTHPAYQRDGLSRLLRENSSRGGFLA